MSHAPLRSDKWFFFFLCPNYLSQRNLPNKMDFKNISKNTERKRLKKTKMRSQFLLLYQYCLQSRDQGLWDGLPLVHVDKSLCHDVDAVGENKHQPHIHIGEKQAQCSKEKCFSSLKTPLSPCKHEQNARVMHFKKIFYHRLQKQTIKLPGSVLYSFPK